MSNKSRGLYGKFNISRSDGTHQPGKKHDGCDYFVLDLTHDLYAVPALRAYAAACEAEYPELASDLREAANTIESRQRYGPELYRRVEKLFMESDPQSKAGAGLCNLLSRVKLFE